MTLKEMAAELGIAASTISRVLNGCNENFSVKTEVRKKIMDLAQKSGYRPNPVFKAIRTLENRQVSVLFRERSVIKAGYVMEAALDAAGEVFEKKQYQLNYILNAGTFETPYLLPHWKVAGVLIPDIVSSKRLSVIEAENLPYVTLNGPCGPQGVSIISNEHANMQIIFEHLLSLGHQRIGYANVSSSGKYQHSSVYDREQAYIQICKELQLPEIDGHQMTVSPLEDDFNNFLKQKATAIVAYNEIIAQQLLYFSWKRGINVPKDLSIVNFNDTENNNFTIPPLTSLAMPAKKMGEIAAQKLIECIESPDAKPEIIKLSGNLVIRDSSNFKKIL